MIGQTAPINHTRDGLPFTGTVTPNTVRTETAQGIFQPVPHRNPIDRGNSVDTIRNQPIKRATGLVPAPTGLIAKFKERKATGALPNPPEIVEKLKNRGTFKALGAAMKKKYG